MAFVCIRSHFPHAVAKPVYQVGRQGIMNAGKEGVCVRGWLNQVNLLRSILKIKRKL